MSILAHVSSSTTMAELLRPRRGGFLYPFGYGWFINDSLADPKFGLMGNGLAGALHKIYRKIGEQIG